MKFYISLFLSFCLSATVLAQDQYSSDSVLHNEQEQKQLQLAMKSIGLLERASLDSYGLTALSVQQEEGSLRRAQEAYSKKSLRFYSEGFKDLGRFSVAGSFLFDRQWEDSLANTLSGEFNELKPFYYFAGKHGEYERQNYRLDALVSYSLIPEKLFVGLGTDYQKHSTTGSVDPRTEVNSFRMLLKPEVSLRQGKHQFSAGAIWGYGNEEVSVGYKNDNYKYSLEYPDRIFYTNQGYGFIVMKDTANLRRYDKHSGWSLSYQTQLRDWNVQARFQHLISNTDNTHDTRYRKNYFLRSSYRQEDFSAEVLISQDAEKHRQQFSLTVLNQSGQDFNTVFQAHNYSGKNQDYRLNYVYQRKKSKAWQPEVGVSLRYRSLVKEDLAADHYLKAESLQPGIHIASSHRFRNNDRLKLSVAPSYRIPMNTVVDVPPTQENVFTETVVYPDFYYFSSRILQLNAGAEYISNHVLQQVPLGFFGDLQYMKQTESRLLVNFGFRIYL